MADGDYESHFLQVINFRLAYKAVVTVPTDLNILIEFQDHGANTSTLTIKVKVNP
jgi:citrate synthase